MTEQEEKTLRDTLQNVIKFQNHLDEVLSRTINVCLNLQQRVERLEAASRKASMAPGLVNLNGERVN